MRSAVDVAVEARMFQHKEEILLFVEWLTRRRKVQRVVEIGMLHGGTSVLWCEIAKQMVIGVDKPNGVFGGADHHLNVQACRARNASLVAKYPQFYGVLGDSQDPITAKEVAMLLGSEKLDLLFIDGDHSYEGVSNDYALYEPLVASGGVIAFHDINDTEFHARQGVEVPRFFKELEGQKYTFTAERAWGGIGAVVKQ